MIPTLVERGRRPVSRVQLVAALLWIVFILGAIGPLLVELLDNHGLTGSVLGLPVIVTEALVIGLVALTPVALFWWRTRRDHEPPA